MAVLLAAGCGGGGGGGTDGTGGPGGTTFVPGVAFVADAEVDELFELYTADLAGTEVRKVSNGLPPGADVVSRESSETEARVRWSPDGSRLAVPVLVAPGQVSLYVVDPASGNPLLLPTGLGTVISYAWSPDSSRVAVQTVLPDPDSAFTSDLLIVTVAGAATSVTPGLPPGRSVLGYQWAPDASRLAYVADRDTHGTGEVYTVFPDGSGNGKVSGAMVAGGTVHLLPDGSVIPVGLPGPAVHWAPDSSALIYRADQESPGVIELFLSTPEGSQNLRISSDLGPETEVWAAAWAPDSSRVAYIAEFVADEPTLVTVLPDGTGEVRIDEADIFGPNQVHAFTIRWSPGADLIAFLGLALPSGREALFTASPTNSEAKPGGPPLGSLDVGIDTTATWSPAGDRIALPVDGSGSDPDLYVVVPALESWDILGTSVSSYAWAPDGSRIAHVDRSGDGAEAFVSFPDGPYGTVLVSPPLGAGLGVRGEVAWSPDSTDVLFRADTFAFEVIELFASPRDAASLRRLSGPLVHGGQVVDFVVR